MIGGSLGIDIDDVTAAARLMVMMNSVLHDDVHLLADCISLDRIVISNGIEQHEQTIANLLTTNDVLAGKSSFILVTFWDEKVQKRNFHFAMTVPG